jgi:hypothetical protein
LESWPTYWAVAGREKRRAMEAAEKLVIFELRWLRSFAGAKAQFILLALWARLMSCPVTELLQ